LTNNFILTNKIPTKLIISDLYLAKFLDTSTKNRCFYVGFELVWITFLARFDHLFFHVLFL